MFRFAQGPPFKDTARNALVCSDAFSLVPLLQAITLVRGLTGDSMVAFRRAVEARVRVDPPLPPTFFGNATVGVPEDNLWARAGDLLR